MEVVGERRKKNKNEILENYRVYQAKNGML